MPRVTSKASCHPIAPVGCRYSRSDLDRNRQSRRPLRATMQIVSRPLEAWTSDGRAVTRLEASGHEAAFPELDRASDFG
jgi:hypothetical protein